MFGRRRSPVRESKPRRRRHEHGRSSLDSKGHENRGSKDGREDNRRARGESSSNKDVDGWVERHLRSREKGERPEGTLIVMVYPPKKILRCRALVVRRTIKPRRSPSRGSKGAYDCVLISNSAFDIKMANGSVSCSLNKLLDLRADCRSVHSASLVIGLIFVVIACVLAYFFSPKGENQTYGFHILSDVVGAQYLLLNLDR